MALLSIIIPVYKTEPYLTQCLDSCIEQIGDGVEIIIVNDGSPDNSQSIIDCYCARYDYIRCLIQPNQGLSSARNRGLDLAQGEYVWFIDSDDWIAPHALKSIMEAISTKPDVVSIKRNSASAKASTPPEPSRCSGKELLLKGRFEHGAVFYICRRSFLEREALRFRIGIYHEDSELIPRLLYLAERVFSTEQPLYNVRENPTSITRTTNPKKSYDLVTVAESLWRFRSESVKEPRFRQVFDKIVAIVVNSAFCNITRSDKCEQRAFNVHVGQHKEILKPLLYSDIKYKIEYILWQLFPNRRVEIYALLKRLG